MFYIFNPKTLKNSTIWNYKKNKQIITVQSSRPDYETPGTQSFVY